MSTTSRSSEPTGSGRASSTNATAQAARIGALSADQLRALRYVLAGYGSKEIASVVGRSPHTVDGWLRQALKILKVSRREQAARLLAEHEGFEPTQCLISQSLSVADDGSATAILHSSNGTGNDLDQSFELHDVSTDGAFREDKVVEALPAEREGPRNALSPGQRIVAIIMIALAAMLAFGALLAGLNALSQLV